MDQTVKKLSSSAASRRATRLAKGYSFEELAVATGLTVAEIAAAEEDDAVLPKHHVERIEHALR
ncbi:XRE family transcriptional regulator [Rhizobium wenxiniae]|nr:XRE family transcriptional regulator [Rhizobium wenxiniae]MBW9091944.1 XRE family transcriptional regulator [Rhizobium wenxiniae]